MKYREFVTALCGALFLTLQICPAEEKKVYTSDFGNFVHASKWSDTRTAVFPGNDRPFLGMFSKKEAPALSLDKLPEHKFVRVKVNLFLLRALDGNFDKYGPDRWAFAVDGTPVFLTSFATVPSSGNGKPRLQSFPDQHPVGNHGVGTGAASQMALGGKESTSISKKNAIYALDMVVPHRRSDLQLQFGSYFTEPVFDEAWGMETVEVSILTEPENKTPEEMEALWKDLAGQSATKAHRAVWTFAATGKAGIEFLSKRQKEMAAEPDGVSPLIQSRIDTVIGAAKIPEQKFVARASASTPFMYPRLACDGKVGKTSGDALPKPFYWTGRRGSPEWLEYRFDKAQTISEAAVFWHQKGEIALPESWHLEVLSAEGKWEAAKNPSGYATETDQWCEAKFDPVETRRLRLVVKLAAGKTVGLSEFRFGHQKAEKEN